MYKPLFWMKNILPYVLGIQHNTIFKIYFDNLLNKLL